nr:transposase [Streptomyces shenzhenensis]
MLHAIRCLVDNGIRWRAVPGRFPTWDRVYAFFRRWQHRPWCTTAATRPNRASARHTTGRLPPSRPCPVRSGRH